MSSFRSRVATHRLLAVVLLLAPAGALSGQDVYIEARSHTDAINVAGRSIPAQDGIQRTWIGENRVAIMDENVGHGVILRADQGKMYLLFPGQKAYYESSLPFQFPEEISEMMSMVKPQITVTPTGRTRIVNGFNTKLTKVNIRMLGQDIAADYWVSKDLGISREKLQKLTQAMFGGNPVLGEMGQKLSSIDGYPVRVDTKVTALGATFGSWQEVRKVEKRAAPVGTYDVPKGYTKTDSFIQDPS
jgi:hypothetical protein